MSMSKQRNAMYEVQVNEKEDKEVLLLEEEIKKHYWFFLIKI